MAAVAPGRTACGSHRRWTLLAVTACAVVAADAIRADTPSPLETVDTSLGRASGVVRGPGDREQKLQSLHTIARELLDTETMGRRAMGEALTSRPAEQQQEFLELFDELAVRAYLGKLLFFRDPEFELLGEEVRERNATVRTLIRTRKEDYSVDYTLRLASSGWRAVDVVVEGVSLTDNYRAQFASLLSRQSFEELLERMRRKLRRPRSEENA